MRTKTKFITSLLVVTFLIVACGSEDPTPTSPIQTSPTPASPIQDHFLIPDPPTFDWDFEEGVYIVGGGYSTKRDIAQMWGNGKLQVITDGEIDAIANAIYVLGDDVFLTGYEYNWDVYNGWYPFPNKAMIWKNGVAQPLTNGNYEAGSFSIFSSNDDVYVAGYESSVAMLWKNGVPIMLTDGTIPTVATSVFVSDGDVYVVGHSDFNKAILWKNGNPQYLNGGSYAASVFVYGNDVYVVGYGSGTILWKNGVAQTLFSDSDNSYALSVCVAGEDVYVAGYEFTQFGNNSYGPTKAMVWKNGVPMPLTNGSQNAIANSISVSGDNVYVVGYNGDIAVIWKNGIAKSLGKGYATGLFIRK